MNGDKVIWVSDEIEHSLSGWFIVDYEIKNKDGDFFQHKKFDRMTDAKRFISECKKEIRNYEQQLKKEYLRYLKY